MSNITVNPTAYNVLFNRATIKGWELRQGCEAFAHHACSALGLKPVRVEWDKGTMTASLCASGTLTLSNVRDEAVINRATLLRYCGYIIHELLHRKYTVFSSIQEGAQYLMQLHNALEDAWIEHSAIDAGLLGNIEGLLSELILAMTLEAELAVKNWSDPRQYPFLLAIWCRRHATRKIPLPQGLESIFDAAATQVLTCQSTEDTFKLAQWVYLQLMNLGQPEEQQGNKPNKSGKESGKDGGQDSPEQPQAGDQAQGKGEGAKGEKKAAGTARAPKPATEASEVEPSLQAPENAATSGTWCKSAIGLPGEHVTSSTRWSTAVTVPAKLRYEVRRLFEDTSYTQVSPNRKSGAINTRALHKFGQSDALFQLRRDIDGIDSAVVICLDVSSSMFDDPKLIKAAVSTASALVDTLEAAGVKSAIVTFGSFVALMADFDVRAKQKKELMSRVFHGGSTNDYAGLRFSHDLLRVRPEQRKVCFVLTDGDGNRKAAREQAHGGTSLGITTIGIGICHNVAGVYPQAVRVNDVSELGQVAFSQIKMAA